MLMVMSSRERLGGGRERDRGGGERSGQTGGAGDGHNGKGLEVRTDRNHEDE